MQSNLFELVTSFHRFCDKKDQRLVPMSSTMTLISVSTIFRCFCEVCSCMSCTNWHSKLAVLPKTSEL